MAFSGMIFLIAPSLRPATVAAIQENGGRAVYSVPAMGPVNCAVQPDLDDNSDMSAEMNTVKGGVNGRNTSCLVSTAGRLRFDSPSFCLHFPPPIVAHLRGRRIPIVEEQFIFCCLSETVYGAATAVANVTKEQHAAVVNGIMCEWVRSARWLPFVAYDPCCMRGVRFTTTQLPRQVKRNVIAAMLFYGATYERDLTRDTTLVIYARVLGGGTAATTATNRAVTAKSGGGGAQATGTTEAMSNGAAAAATEAPQTKLAAAQLHRIPCVLPSWVQDCVKYGRLLPISSAPLSPEPQQQQWPVDVSQTPQPSTALITLVSESSVGEAITKPATRSPSPAAALVAAPLSRLTEALTPTTVAVAVPPPFEVAVAPPPFPPAELTLHDASKLLSTLAAVTTVATRSHISNTTSVGVLAAEPVTAASAARMNAPSANATLTPSVAGSAVAVHCARPETEVAIVTERDAARADTVAFRNSSPTASARNKLRTTGISTTVVTPTEATKYTRHAIKRHRPSEFAERAALPRGRSSR